MPSRSRAWPWLVRKECRALRASRAWWLMFGLVGPLVGVSFIRAVDVFSEASAGATTGGGEAFNPLDGIWAPTFGAFEVAAVFLLPFLAISVVANDRQHGTLKLELQRHVSPVLRLASKAAVVLLAWTVTGLAAIAAVALWRGYGGSVYAPEVLGLALGHELNAAITIALSMAAASITKHPSTAAIAALAVTVGTWILAFVAAVHGGVWTQLAGYTPTALVAMFQHGLVRLDVILVALVVMSAALGLAAVWLPLGIPGPVRARRAAALIAGALLLVVPCAWAYPSWDVSENRRNSLAPEDARMVRAIAPPLQIDVHLAPQDPRRVDFDHQALPKLRRVKRDVTVRYIARTSIGMWEQADEGYGEIWYELSGRRVLGRATSVDGVLTSIAEIAGVTREEPDPAAYLGHPLHTRPVGAAWLFYLVWPAVAAGGFMKYGRQS